MAKRALIVSFLLCITWAASAFAQLQQCPDVTPEQCQAEENDCDQNCPGKDGDEYTCFYEICPAEYNDCLYGVHQAGQDTVTYPITSKTSQGCIIGVTASTCPWFDPPRGEEGYTQFDTYYQEVHSYHHACDNGFGYQYDDIEVTDRHDTCYQYNDAECWSEYSDCCYNYGSCNYCNTYSHAYESDAGPFCIGGSCFINETGDQVRWTPY